MSKSKQCAEKAAEVIKKNCTKKTNKLAYVDQKNTKGKCNPVYAPKVSSCRGTKIHYCTAQELKLMAGKRFCECPDRTITFDPTKFILNTMKNFLKAAAALGLAYITYDLGFWGSPRDTERAFAGLCGAMPCPSDPCKSQKFEPKTGECREATDLLEIPPSDDPCSCQDPIPIDVEHFGQNMKQIWNRSIVFIFEGIVNGPQKIFCFVSETLERFNQKDCGKCKRVNESKFSKNIPTNQCAPPEDYEDEDLCTEKCEDGDGVKVNQDEEMEAILESQIEDDNYSSPCSP